MPMQDLNRCRSYLADLVARRGQEGHKIVYTSIVQATCAAVRLVKELRPQPKEDVTEACCVEKAAQVAKEGDGR